MLLPEKTKCTGHTTLPQTTKSGDSQHKSKYLQLIYTAQFTSSVMTVNMHLTPTVLTAHTNDKKMKCPEAEVTGMLTGVRL